MARVVQADLTRDERESVVQPLSKEQAPNKVERVKSTALRRLRFRIYRDIRSSRVVHSFHSRLKSIGLAPVDFLNARENALWS